VSEYLQDVHITFLEGLGSSYRMKGYFMLKTSEEKPLKFSFRGVAFGGHYGGHNVSVEITAATKKKIIASAGLTEGEFEQLVVEIQRRMLNGEMVVEYENLKPESQDPLGNLPS
jgi:hypothetical protein